MNGSLYSDINKYTRAIVLRTTLFIQESIKKKKKIRHKLSELIHPLDSGCTDHSFGHCKKILKGLLRKIN